MGKIVPHLWYDKSAKEAALFYTSLFEKSKILSTTVLEDTPSGNAEAVSFELDGQEFQAISAGPFFQFNPSISLMTACFSIEEVNKLYEALIEGGKEIMSIGEYPFSKRYCWVQDRYGLSWQLIFVDNDEKVQKIIPNFLFSNGVCGKAEDAVKFYNEVFSDSEIGIISRYKEGEAESPMAKVNYGAFKLAGFSFSAMDNSLGGNFTFNEAFSLIINCENQQEIDYYWDKLSAVPEAEICGWIKDKFGVSWQIVPKIMNEMMSKGSREQIKRLTEAFLKMKKFDIVALQKAYDGI